MSAGSTHAFRHLHTGRPCPVLPKAVCPEALAEHHRPRHALPIVALSDGLPVKPRHRKRVPTDSAPSPTGRWYSRVMSGPGVAM